MKIVKKMAIILLLVLLAMQFYRPPNNLSQGDHTVNFSLETNPTKEVRAILRNACYDCHSNNTQYPWYNTIAPISYWLYEHVEDGKEAMNLSTWGDYTTRKKSHMLGKIIEVVESNEMPLKPYTLMHAEAKLTSQQRQAVTEWAKRSRVLYELNQQPR